MKIIKELYGGEKKTMIKGNVVYFLGTVPFDDGLPGRDKEIAEKRAELNAYKNLIKEQKIEKATGSVTLKKMLLPKTGEMVVLMRANAPKPGEMPPVKTPGVTQSRDPVLP